MSQVQNMWRSLEIYLAGRKSGKREIKESKQGLTTIKPKGSCFIAHFIFIGFILITNKI